MEAATATPPAAAAPAPGPADWLRMLGGVTLAVGAVVLFVRKSGPPSGDHWADFPRLLVLGVPCVLLYGLGAAGRRPGELERWRAVLMITGVLLAPLALEQLRETVGLSQSSSFWHFLVFATTAALAGYSAFVMGVAYQAFLAAIAGVVAWVFLWDWILSSPGIHTVRWLLLLLGICYLVGGLVLRGGGAPQGHEIITVAAIVGVVVGLIGVAEGGLRAAIGSFFGGLPGGHGQGFFWYLVLLVVSLSSIAYSAVSRVRGPGYVGFIGLAVFTLLVGVEVDALIKGNRPDGSFVGWPLALLLIGAGGLAAGVAADRRTAR
jgi:hypothetical protein